MMWKVDIYDTISLWDARFKYKVFLRFIKYEQILLITVDESSKAGLALSWLGVD